MYNPKRFGLYIPSESATLDCISQTRHSGPAFPSTTAQNLVHLYRSGLPISHHEGVPRLGCDNLHRTQLSAASPLESSYDWEYEPLALSGPIVRPVFSPSCE